MRTAEKGEESSRDASTVDLYSRFVRSTPFDDPGADRADHLQSIEDDDGDAADGEQRDADPVQVFEQCDLESGSSV